LPQTKPVAPAPTPENKSAPALEAPGDITDGRRFIQAGVFGEPENAAKLVNKLREAKLPAKEMPLTLGERQFTRVVIGPYQTVAERNAALNIVRTVGPADATFVRG
jgi:cell division septation protein DedD